MSRVRIANCPAGMVIAVAIMGVFGVFLFVANFAERLHSGRLGFEALLLLPLLLCLMLVRRVNRS